MRTSETVTKAASALVKAQRKMGAATKGAANPYFKSKYADLGAVMEVVKDPLNEEGFTILQPSFSKEGSHYVETVLLHESGEFISSGAMKLELNKIDMQSLGSAITYMRRYQLQSLTGTPSEDDDAEGTMGRSKSAQKTPERPKVDLTARTPDPVPLAVVKAVEMVQASLNSGQNTTTLANLTPAAPAPKTTFRKSVPKLNI
jgi:ERF superfamily